MAKTVQQKSRVLHEGGKLEKVQEVENFIYSRYNVRYNTIKHVTEFQRVGANEPFAAMTDRGMYSMIRRLKIEEKIKISLGEFIQIVESDFAPEFDPIVKYFSGLPEPDEDRIPTYMDELAGHVVLKNKKYVDVWYKIFRAWLVSCVANSLERTGCQNQTCLVLTGGQGTGKSYFLNYLCPPGLQDYLYANPIDLKSKDTFIMLGQNFIINIDDQLDNLYKQDAETMKTLISSIGNPIRLPHGKKPQYVPRIANFCASVNHTEFLRDETGNRRMLPFEIKGIDWGYTNIDINKVWAEAYSLYKSGKFKYKYSASELNAMFDNFSDFFVISPEEELLLTYFELRKPDEKQSGTFEKLSASEIEAELSAKSTGKRLSHRTIGQIMKKLNCETGTRTGGVRCFWVRRKDNFEIERDRGGLKEITLPPPVIQKSQPVQGEIFN